MVSNRWIDVFSNDRTYEIEYAERMLNAHGRVPNFVLLVRILLRVLSQRFDDSDDGSIPIVFIERYLLRMQRLGEAATKDLIAHLCLHGQVDRLIKPVFVQGDFTQKKAGTFFARLIIVGLPMEKNSAQELGLDIRTHHRLIESFLEHFFRFLYEM